MTVLVFGGTGNFGSLVVEELTRRGADVRALGRKEPSGGIASGAELVTGDVLDIDRVRGLLEGVDTVFLLAPAVPDELPRSLLTLSLIAEAGITRLVYLSMMGADSFVDAPRAAVKRATEEAIAWHGLPATVLRPNAVFQNDLALLETLHRDHVYATPLGGVGVTLVDNRDVAEVAALELLRREDATQPLPSETIDVVGPQAFTGASMAALWSQVLTKPVRYVGDDLDAVEAASREAMSASDAYDLRLVFGSILRDGVLGGEGAADRLVQMLGRPLRDYRRFAQEAVDQAGPFRSRV